MKGFSLKPQTKAGKTLTPNPERTRGAGAPTALGQLQLFGLAWHSWQRAAVAFL